MELVLDRVTKQYRNKIAVDRMSYVMRPGVYGLLGANGAGKTTLMRMICGVLKPGSGEVKLDGLDVEEEGYRDRLGYLPQNFGYYPEFTAMDFLLYMAALKGIPKREAKGKAKELLELVNLSGESKKKVKTFSGGMKQRLGIAQALLNNPQLLVLDEPTAGLDPKERVKFRNMIAKLGKDRIVLLSTHIVSDVEYIANEILVMKEGKLIHHGALEDVIAVIRGKVYECKTDRETGQRMSAEYPIVNLREEADGMFLRLISENKPCENAVLVEETLEDLYLYYFSGQEEKKDA